MISLLLAIVIAVGPEIASTPVHPFTASPLTVQPAVTAASDGAGFVIAWTSMSDSALRPRTVVARLDSSGQAVFGSTRELPTTQPYYDAMIPSVAAAPNGYFVAQTESAPLSQRVVAWHLDRTLEPDPAPFAIIATEKTTGVMPAGLVRVDGGRVFVVTSSTINEYALDGTFVQATPAHFPADDAVVANGTLVTAGDESAPFTQLCWWRCSPAVPEHFDIFLSYGAIVPPPVRLPFYSPNRAGIAFDGSSLIYVFPYPQTMQFLRFDVVTRGQIDSSPRILGAYAALDGPTKPAVAFDGTRYLVVWQSALDGRQTLAAAAVERDGTVTPVTFPNLGDEETLPAVIAAGPNRFLVSYRSQRGVDFYLAGRFVTFGSRRPAAGR